MEGCKNCKQPFDTFNTMGKTYYRLKEDNSIVCYRHWHQIGRPEFKEKGDYSEIFCKPNYTRKYEKRKTV